MKLIRKKLKPADIKIGKVYFKTMKSGRVKTREVVEFYCNEYYEEAWRGCLRFLENGKKREIPMGGKPLIVYFESAVLTFCRWAHGIVEDEP